MKPGLGILAAAMDAHYAELAVRPETEGDEERAIRTRAVVRPGSRSHPQKHHEQGNESVDLG